MKRGNQHTSGIKYNKGKSTSKSSSDEFLLGPTRENKTYSSANGGKQRSPQIAQGLDTFCPLCFAGLRAPRSSLCRDLLLCKAQDLTGGREAVFSGRVWSWRFFAVFLSPAVFGVVACAGCTCASGFKRHLLKHRDGVKPIGRQVDGDCFAWRLWVGFLRKTDRTQLKFQPVSHHMSFLGALLSGGVVQFKGKHAVWLIAYETNPYCLDQAGTLNLHKCISLPFVYEWGVDCPTVHSCAF